MVNHIKKMSNNHLIVEIRFRRKELNRLQEELELYETEARARKIFNSVWLK